MFHLDLTLEDTRIIAVDSTELNKMDITIYDTYEGGLPIKFTLSHTLTAKLIGYMFHPDQPDSFAVTRDELIKFIQPQLEENSKIPF